MIIDIKKFGTILISRQLGKEAFSAFLPNFDNLPEEEKIYVNFDGIDVFSPSWGDEFLSPLLNSFGDKLKLEDTENSSVNLTVKILEKTNGYKFNKD